MHGLCILFSLTYRPNVSTTFFLKRERDEAPFLHQLKTLCNYSSSWKGTAVGPPNFWLFTPLSPLVCLNYTALGIL